jgi:hypothetical protein
MPHVDHNLFKYSKNNYFKNIDPEILPSLGTIARKKALVESFPEDGTAQLRSQYDSPQFNKFEFILET